MDNGWSLFLSCQIHLDMYRRLYDLWKSQLNLNIITTYVCMVKCSFTSSPHTHVVICARACVHIRTFASPYMLNFMTEWRMLAGGLRLSFSHRFLLGDVSQYSRYQSSSISRMDTPDNLWSHRLTRLINERGRFNDNEKINEECPEHALRDDLCCCWWCCFGKFDTKYC